MTCFPEEKGRCSDASNKHRKWGDPGAFISVFLPGLLGKYADALFLKMLMSPQLVTHSLLHRQGLGNWMGKLRHGEARHDGLPKMQNSFAQPAPIIGTTDDVPWGWSGDPPTKGMAQHQSPGCFTKRPCLWPAAHARRGQHARYSRHWHASLSRHRWAAGSDPAHLLMPEELSGSCTAPAARLCHGMGHGSSAFTGLWGCTQHPAPVS